MSTSPPASVKVSRISSTSLLTDHYELTMVDAALAAGEATTPCVFEVFTRRLPIGRRFGVFAGVGRLLDELANFRFTSDEVQWLQAEGIVSEATAKWLMTYEFSGSISGYREGELYFPGSPVLSVQGTFAECVLLETLVLSVLNHDSAVASAAARMVLAADGKPVIEMGGRRTHERAAVSAARAAYIAGFTSTSNSAAGYQYGIPTTGTAAHAFTLLYDAESEAFDAQVGVRGAQTTLLVDTYDTEAGVDRALNAAGADLGAVRIDSGDLQEQAWAVRAQLDARGATNTKIVVSGDLDERRIAELQQAPIDLFGAGTSVVTGSGHPTSGMVYKLTARQQEDGSWLPVAKYSPDKATMGGRKFAARQMTDAGVATHESVVVSDTEPEWSESERPLVTTLVDDGKPREEFVGVDGISAARERCAASIAELSESGRSLTHGMPSCQTMVTTSGPPVEWLLGGTD